MAHLTRYTAPVVLVLVFSALLVACSEATPTPDQTLTPTASQVPATPEPETTPEEGQILSSPTPAPTATPGAVQDLVDEVVAAVGAEKTEVLGLQVSDWINLLFSVVIVLLGVLVIYNLTYFVLERITKQTESPHDNEFLHSIRSQIQWFAWVFSLDFAINRLPFLSPTTKQTAHLAALVLYILIGTLILWKLIDFALDWYVDSMPEEEQAAGRDASIIIQRLARLGLLLISATVVFSTIGFDVTALVAALGVAGLALSLASQDTLSNMISGFIILTDKPFRVGDRIEIASLNTWGDVVEIGVRTTRIRTRDNRMVIVPNSVIGTSQVVNYTYPDPRYRVQIELGIDDGYDLNVVRKVIREAVQNTEGILEDKPIDILLLDIDERTLMFRVRWWIDTYVDTRRMFDQINSAIYDALKEAGIRRALTSYEIQVLPEEGEENSPRTGA